MHMGIDIETYSDVDLIACGVYPYSESAAFEVMLIAYKVDAQPVKLIDFSSESAQIVLPGALHNEQAPIPIGNLEEFTRLLFDPTVIKTAYNANFERVCLAKHFGRKMAPEQWRCTKVLAASLGLPGSLAAVGSVLGLDKQKLTEGKALVDFFCKPSKSNGSRNLAEHAPDKWAAFRRYCVRDVESETEIIDSLAGYTLIPDEQRAWELDQRINDRGVRADTMLARNALELDRKKRTELKAEAVKLTGLPNPNSDAQLKCWLTERGLEATSLDKESLPLLLSQAPDAKTRRVLELRREWGKTSNKKYEAALRSVCTDSRIRGLLQFYGASRTGRWAGRLVQVQNLPQNKLLDLAVARELVMQGDFELLELLFGAPAFVLSQLIRTVFIPSEGRQFVVADYSAIEARVLAWLAGENWVLDEFRGEGLIYEATASTMFHVPKEQIKKGGVRAELRAKGKVATLACGYQGSVGALVQMGALTSGIPEDDLPGLVRSWRTANKNIVRYWYDVEAAAVRAVEGGSAELRHGVTFTRDQDYLFIELPSGRRLAYYMPQLEYDPKYNKRGISYLGVDQGKWARRRTYGGMLVENITQAVARDCLRDAMLSLENAGYEIVMHCHDEVIIDAPDECADLDRVIQIMSSPLPWAPELPLNADGFICDFYRKE